MSPQLIPLRFLGWVALMTFAIIGVFKIQDSRTDARFRGLSVVDANTIWASGTRGTFVRTTDGGTTWVSGTVPGAEALDFRDVHGVSTEVAYLLASGEKSASRIYKTRDAGRTWTLQFTNEHPKGFLDALAFWDPDRGLALGDPTDGRFTILATEDGGTSWTRIGAEGLPEARPTEGAFAASGTCLVTFGESNAWFATGGAGKGRVFRTADRGKHWSVAETPILADRPSSGIFSLGFRDAIHGVAVGGDYLKPGQSTSVIALTSDGGATWTIPKGPGPRGYRSAVAWIPAPGSRTWVAAGPSGVDVSGDDGETWAPLDPGGFHAVAFSRTPSTGWAVGDGGKIVKIERILPQD